MAQGINSYDKGMLLTYTTRLDCHAIGPCYRPARYRTTKGDKMSTKYYKSFDLQCDQSPPKHTPRRNDTRKLRQLLEVDP